MLGQESAVTRSGGSVTWSAGAADWLSCAVTAEAPINSIAARGSVPLAARRRLAIRMWFRTSL